MNKLAALTVRSFFSPASPPLPAFSRYAAARSESRTFANRRRLPSSKAHQQNSQRAHEASALRWHAKAMTSPKKQDACHPYTSAHPPTHGNKRGFRSARSHKPCTRKTRVDNPSGVSSTTQNK